MPAGRKDLRPSTARGPPTCRADPPARDALFRSGAFPLPRPLARCLLGLVTHGAGPPEPGARVCVCVSVPRSASASQTLRHRSREPTWLEPGRGGRSAVGLLHGPLLLRFGVRAGARDWVGLGGPTHAEPCVVPPLLSFSVGPGSGQWVWRGTRIAGRAPRGSFRHWPQPQRCIC